MFYWGTFNKNNSCDKLDKYNQINTSVIEANKYLLDLRVFNYMNKLKSKN